MSKKSKVFMDYSKYYDLLYRDKDYEKESKYIKTLLYENNIKNTELLEFGSGTGKHAEILSKKFGYKIHGVDLSEEMIRHANHNKNFFSEVGDMRSYNAGRSFKCVLALFHVVSYLSSKQDINKFFSNAACHLQKDGLLIFDVWHSKCVNFLKPQFKVKRMEDKYFEIFRITEPKTLNKTNQIEVNFTTFVKNKKNEKWNKIVEKHLMKHFTKDEISNFAKKYGFRILKSEEWVTRNRPSKETWGVCYILKKVK